MKVMDSAMFYQCPSCPVCVRGTRQPDTPFFVLYCKNCKQYWGRYTPKREAARRGLASALRGTRQ